MDTSNREIISYVLSKSQTLTLAMKTLKQAIRGRKVKNVILHSNQGSFQACTKEAFYSQKTTKVSNTTV